MDAGVYLDLESQGQSHDLRLWIVSNTDLFNEEIELPVSPQALHTLNQLLLPVRTS
jgi:hypothetical protein